MDRKIKNLSITKAMLKLAVFSDEEQAVALLLYMHFPGLRIFHYRGFLKRLRHLECFFSLIIGNCKLSWSFA